ncbi:MAG TPA: PLD nuclease N-terminal domain-containing protein [Pirellulaceae bacterium]|nr:PLDc_N domain-containing protein [Planctomycetales bacterium]MCB9938675.1 PLDc_N domain-containing protein [Planctomycetaceae bacterium]HRX82190.1 PLD nuclease N-terminal domain-containing protein [Pirellulaceae bacterium]
MTEQSIAIFPILFMLIFSCLGLVGCVFWIWMLVDCLTKEPSEGNDKIIWVLVIVLLNWLGALIYFCVRRPQRITKFGK